MAYFYTHSLKKLEDLDTVIAIYNNESITITHETMTKVAIYEKYFIISLYTIWDNSNIDVLKDIYNNYPLLFSKKDFVFQHLDTVFTNNRLRKKLKREIDDFDTYDFNTIDIQNMVDSNNLWFDNLIKLLKIYNFNTEILDSYFYNSDKLKDTVASLDSSAIIPYYLNDNSTPTDASKILYKKIRGYINYIVNTRNSYAHKYKTPYSEFSNDEFVYLYDFIDSLIKILDTYIKEQILLSCINDNVEDYLKPINLSNLNILSDKMKDDVVIEVEFTVLNEYNINLQDKLIFNNSEKDVIDKVNIFKLNEIYEKSNTGIFNQLSGSNITLYKDRPYKLKLEDISKKREIKTIESQNIKLFIDK